MNELIKATFGNKIRVRSCGICVKNNAVLLVRHHGLGKKNILWIPPGGGINVGESAKEALKREFLEETGLIIEVGDFLFVNEFLQTPLHAIELFFSVKIIGGTISSGKDPELPKDHQIIKEVKFVTFEEIEIMDNAELHNVLHEVSNEDSLLNMRGHFKYFR